MNKFSYMHIQYGKRLFLVSPRVGSMMTCKTFSEVLTEFSHLNSPRLSRSVRSCGRLIFVRHSRKDGAGYTPKTPVTDNGQPFSYNLPWCPLSLHTRLLQFPNSTSWTLLSFFVTSFPTLNAFLGRVASLENV